MRREPPRGLLLLATAAGRHEMRGPGTWPIRLPRRRMGDKLRWGEESDSGLSDHGTPYGSLTCFPLQEAEVLNNPNFF